MPKFLVELEDGKKFQVEADQQPSPEEISQYLGGQTQPEKSFLDLSETASSLGRAVTSLPTTTMASLSQAWEGLENPWKRSEGYLSRRQEMQALQDELAASEAEAAASGDASTVSSAIRAATPSLGGSFSTLGPSIAAGAGTLALSKSPAAARGAAAATSALMAYRMAGAQFLDDAKERIDAYFQENVGRAPNEQEQAEAYQELLPLARKFGAAEAGPEALGNLALGGAGKYIRRALGGKGGIVDLASNALGKVTGTKAALAGAGALASEVGTEAVTGVEQSRIQKQFEEGIMRGESPESVALADRSLGDYTSAIEEVAPATIATVGMMGAAGLGPKAISRGIQALRSKPPVEQIVEEPSMPDPAEVAKTIGDASVEQLAATGNEASAAAQADFNAILAETLGETPEPTIQPEQAAEEAGAEVTPLSEGAERVVTPEEESLAAKRRADLLSAAADVAKGKTKAQVSPAVTAMVTPQPVETQEDAAREIPLKESVRQEPQDRIESREAEETGAGDQLLSPATGEEEVATFDLNPLTKPKSPPRKGFYGEVKGASGQTLGSLWKDKDGNFRVYQLEDFSNRIIAESPPIPKERIKKTGGVQVSAGQSVQFYRILPSSDLVDGDRQSESQNQPPQKPVTEPETAGQSSAQAVKAGVSEDLAYKNARSLWAQNKVQFSDEFSKIRTPEEFFDSVKKAEGDFDKLPEVSKQAALEIYSPQTKQAAEKQTPVPLREGTGAAGVVQSEPVEGSIPTVEKVSPETESESSEKLDPKLVEAEQKQAEADKAAEKKRKKREEMRSKTIDSIIGDAEKKKREFGQVTNSDAIAALAMLVASKDVPGVLTAWTGTREDFLRDPENQMADPDVYSRVKSGELVEGLFSKGRSYVFLDRIGVSDQDLLRGKEMGVSAQVAAVRRVLLHESLVHRGIHGLPLRHRRLILNWVRQNSTPAELDDLAKLYTEYANWRNSDYDFEALAEELLAKKVDSLTEIPKDGPMAKLMDILRQIWDFIVGYKREPTLSDLKSVVKLLKSGAEALANDRLKDGGEVKLSMIAPTAGITPEMDAEYLAAVEAGDMEKAQEFVDKAAGGFASMEEQSPSEFSYGDENDAFFYHVTTKDRLEQVVYDGEGLVPNKGGQFAGAAAQTNSRGKVFFTERSGVKVWMNQVEQQLEQSRDYDEGQSPEDDLAVIRIPKHLVSDKQDDDPRNSPVQVGRDFFSAKPIPASPEAVTRDDDGNVIPLSQRFQTASPDIRFSRPEFASDTSAAVSAGSEAARSTLYSERDMDIREAIRRSYEAMPKTNSVAVPIGDLFAKTEELMPGVTQEEFSLVLQDLFEDNGAVLQEGDSEFIVTTPEGRRAGFVVVMPRAAKASRIKAEGAAVSKLQEDVRNIDEGSVKADFEGRQFTDTKPNQRTIKPKQSYTDAAVEFVDSLQNEGNSLEDIAYSIQSPEFIEGLGIERDLSMQDAIGLEVRNRINNALRKEKAPSVKARLNKLNLSLSKFWQGIGSVKGQHLAIRQKLIADPRYRWMFIKDKAEEAMKEARENVATANITSTDDLTNQMNREGEKASERAGQSVADETEAAIEDDQDAIDLAAGEATLKDPEKSLYEEYKDLLREEGILARLDELDNIKDGSKASISAERRNELAKLTREERAKLREKNKNRRMEILAKLLGKESDAKTPEQKKIRGKRIKGIQTLEKRVKKGKPVDVEIEGEPESSEEQVSKAEKTAQSILKGLSERYSDPLIIKEKKPNVDAMRELYKERVKQGVGPNQMTEESFVSKAVELGADEKTAGILWKAAELEIDAREAMRQDKILQRKAAVGARADAQAHRIIFAKERLKRQSGFSGIDSNANKDTIIKAFQEQVKTPVSIEDFIARLRPLNVSETVAKRLFTAAEREKADLEAMEAFRMLEGPDALKNILREIERMRRGEEIPLRTPIPWRQLLSQKAKTVEEYRQRIFDAISANEAFQNLPDDKKTKLADLFSEAWESKRKDILERMLNNLINKEEAAKRISQKGAQALREQSQRLVEDINLGILDSDELMKRLAEKFGIKSEFTEEEKQKIDSLIDTLQDSTLNRVKRNKAAYDLLKTLSGTVKVPVTKLMADLWVTNVLSGINTMTSIALAVSSGAFELTSGVLRIIKAAIANQKELPAEISASFKSLARFLGAFPREANLAWQYLVTGDRAFLDPSMNDVLNDLNYDSIGKSVSLAERLAESDKLLEKTVGVWMRTVSRLLTALDSFNSGVTKSGAIPIVARQLELDPATLAKAEESMNLQNYKDRIIQRDFAGVAPKTAREKALVDSWAKDEMMADLDKYGEFTENADFFGQQGAMTLDPSGIGGMIYRLIKSVTGNLSAGSDRFLAESQRKWQERGKSDSMDATRLALAYALQFIAYNSANLAGLRFARFAGNKFNQGLSFIPGIGMLRLFEADLDKTHVKGKDAFMDMIQRNQFAGVMMSVVGLAILKAIADEPDDEKRGWSFNGGWANLTPERKQQKLAAGEKEYTIRVGDKVFNYQNWPISSVLAAIGGLSDLIRYSPEQWNEKSIAGRLGSAAASGVFAASEIPALSQFQELFGSNLSSKDPNEKKLDRFSRVMAGWGGGFVPRILKDFDFLAEPTLKKYDTLWERTASHIPVYRRYVGDDYYDILGKPIERKIYPGSREFMEKPSAPEYQILGKLNSRGIWLTPANAEHRMVGKGRNKRKLTQEEADAYSLETGKGYRQMLLRYGQRALQMPTERARAFLSDKADEVRDRALKKVYRR